MPEIRRNASIAAVLVSAMIKGCISAYLITLFSLHMELTGVPTRIIGLAYSFQVAALLLVTMSMPRFLYRTNLFHMQGIACLTGIAALCGLMVFVDRIAFHLALRLLLGCGICSSYIVYEYWLNSVTLDRMRGRIMALYGTCVVSGMALGPLLIPMVGTTGNLPYWVGMALFAISMLPIFLARRQVPELHDIPPSAGILGIIRLSPTVAMVGLMFGIAESGMFGFMSIYGLREGLSEDQSVWLLSLIMWGGMALQLPIGWLADHKSARFTLLAVTGIGLAGGMILPLLIHHPGPLLWGHMLFWGGVVTTIYTIGTILLGSEHKRANLANATLAFVMMYGVGNIIGPVMTGEALERLGPSGLPWVMGLACGSVFVFTAWRTWKRKHQ